MLAFRLTLPSWSPEKQFYIAILYQGIYLIEFEMFKLNFSLKNEMNFQPW